MHCSPPWLFMIGLRRCTIDKDIQIEVSWCSVGPAYIYAGTAITARKLVQIRKAGAGFFEVFPRWRSPLDSHSQALLLYNLPVDVKPFILPQTVAPVAG